MGAKAHSLVLDFMCIPQFTFKVHNTLLYARSFDLQICIAYDKHDPACVNLADFTEPLYLVKISSPYTKAASL